MPAKFCLDCGELTRDGSRCADCQQERTARINARPKGNTTARGLGWMHQKRTRELLKQPGLVCVRCGLPGTPDDPLTGGHTVDRSRGGVDSPLRPEHRSCGSRAGAQLRRSKQ